MTLGDKELINYQIQSHGCKSGSETIRKYWEINAVVQNKQDDIRIKYRFSALLQQRQSNFMSNITDFFLLLFLSQRNRS
jgi:hypothetical protein